MAIDSLTASLKAAVAWTAQDSLTGTDYSPNVNQTGFSTTRSIASATASNAAGGGNEVVSFIQSIAAGGDVTLDLEAVANIFGTTVDLVRLKGVLIRLLSTTDDSTNGTAASSVTIGNATANQQTLWMDAATDTFTLKNGEFIAWATSQAAGLTVDATHSDLKIVNNDGAVIAKVQITLFGATN